MIKISQMNSPLRICRFTPVAYRLEKRAGTNARKPLIKASAIELSVPNTAEDGEMSFTHNCIAAGGKVSASVAQQMHILTERHGDTTAKGSADDDKSPEEWHDLIFE